MFGHERHHILPRVPRCHPMTMRFTGRPWPYHPMYRPDETTVDVQSIDSTSASVPKMASLSCGESTRVASSGWRWCKKCQSLCFQSSSASDASAVTSEMTCVMGDMHDFDGSANYYLNNESKECVASRGWRCCIRCHTVQMGSVVQPNSMVATPSTAASSSTPLDGALSTAASNVTEAKPVIVAPATSVAASASMDNKDVPLPTYGMIRAQIAAAGAMDVKGSVPTVGPCVATRGPHEYRDETFVLCRSEKHGGQSGWTSCIKCNILFFGPFKEWSKCAVTGGTHDDMGSSIYRVYHDVIIGDDREDIADPPVDGGVHVAATIPLTTSLTTPLTTIRALTVAPLETSSPVAPRASHVRRSDPDDGECCCVIA